LQRFWVPVHIAITVFVLTALVSTWSEVPVRRLLLTGLVSYIAMRVWSGLYFIPEMLAFQEIPLDAPPSVELEEGVLVVVQRAAQCCVISVFSPCPL